MASRHLLRLASLPDRYVFNMLSNRISALKLLMRSLVAQAVGIVMLVQANSLVCLILYVVIYGSVYGVFSPLRASVMADHFGRMARSPRCKGSPWQCVQAWDR